MHLVSTGIMPFCRNREFNNAPINYCKCQLPSPLYDHVTRYARGNHVWEIANDIRLLIHWVIFVQSMAECKKRTSYHGCVPLSQHHNAAGETSKVESKPATRLNLAKPYMILLLKSYRRFLQSLFSAIFLPSRETALCVPSICLEFIPRFISQD